MASYTFSTGAEGWTTTTNSSTEQWQLTPPGHNDNQAFAVTPYSNESTATLRSPELTLSGTDWSTVRVSWFVRQDTEDCCDYLSLDWSSDGYVWHNAYSNAEQNPDFPNFSPVTAEFAAAPGKLFIRFRLTSDQLVSSPPYTGVAVDDVVVKR